LEKLKTPEGRIPAEYNGGFTDPEWREVWAKKNQGFSWEQIHSVTKRHVSAGSLSQAAVAWARETGYAAAKINSRKTKTTKRAVQPVSIKRKKAKRRRKKLSMSPAYLDAVRRNAKKARQALARKVAARRASANGNVHDHPIAAKSR
jgi:hypothetical protein